MAELNDGGIYFTLAINGKELDFPRMKRIVGVEVENGEDGSDTLTLTVVDPDRIYVEDDIFIEDVPVYLEMGWFGSSVFYTFDGYIALLDIDFSEDGICDLVITCMDKTHLMNRKKKSRSWKGLTRPEVISVIAKEYGFSFYKQPNYNFKVVDEITQSNQTDIEFILGLAGEESELFTCKYRKGTIYYVKKGLLNKSKADLGYHTGDCSVISFSPEVNRETRQKEVTSSGVTSSKTVTKATVNSSGTEQGNPINTTDGSDIPNFGPNYSYDIDSDSWGMN